MTVQVCRPCPLPGSLLLCPRLVLPSAPLGLSSPMLAHPHLQIPKYLAEYSPKPPAYFPDISSIVSAALSPVRSDSPGDNPTDHSSPISPQENCASFEIPSNYSSASNARASGYIINSPSGLRSPDADAHYLSESPSPIDVQQVPSLSHPSSAPPSQDRFPHTLEPLYTGADRTITDTNSNSERCSRTGQMDKYSGSILDQRRMSEPAVLSGPQAYHPGINSTSRHPSLNFAFNIPDVAPIRSSSSMYLSPGLHRGASTGSLRDLRQHHYDYPSSHHDWKEDPELQRDNSGYFGSDESVSPLQSNFGGGMPYSPISENFYGASPPGTGTSGSSSAPLSADASFPTHNFSKVPMSQHSGGATSSEADRKNYSFIALPGNAVKKRPRRRYDEIERLYQCSWPDCSKAYGTLNHLNAHVTMQKHGAKRSPSEFKELRKKWRAAKKEAETHMGMGLRRGSFNGHHDDYEYGSRFAFSHTSQRSHSFHQSNMDFPTTIGMNHSIGHSMHPISYSSHREDEAVDYDGRRYGEILPPSWQGNSVSTRGLPEAFVSSSFPSNPLRHSHLPQLTITDAPRHHSVPMPPSPPRTIHQLPSNSTLLTPLPGYHTNQSFMSVSHDSVPYAGESYEFCDDNSRPGTGNTSVGPPSSDDMHDF